MSLLTAHSGAPFHHWAEAATGARAVKAAEYFILKRDLFVVIGGLRKVA